MPGKIFCADCSGLALENEEEDSGLFVEQAAAVARKKIVTLKIK